MSSAVEDDGIIPDLVALPPSSVQAGSKSGHSDDPVDKNKVVPVTIISGFLGSGM